MRQGFLSSWKAFRSHALRALRLRALAQTWEFWGESDPLWAVLADPGKRGGRWDPESFFESGRTQVRGALELVAELGWPLQKGAALDFGSGVGRLSQALCEHFKVVDGVDIARSMIDVAERFNRFPERCTYHLNFRDDLSIFPDGRFDFVYSTYVLQHMPPDLARGYVEEFLRVLAPRGLALFQIPTGRRSGPTPPLPLVWIRNWLPHPRRQMRIYTTPARTVEEWIGSANGHLISEIHSPPNEVYDGFLFAATRASST